MKKILLVVLLSVAAFSLAVAQSKPAPAAANPFVSDMKMQLVMVKGYITKAAAEVPENLYAYKATAEVRSFGQMFGHIADSNYEICAAAAGQKPPVEGIEKSTTAKADLVKALGESFSYCEKIFDGTSDADAAKMIDSFGRQHPKMAVLTFNTSHDWEHYGNIVTYMRLNKMVPPSSQPSR
jgi:uncharacterized damage-inducible protein DinB